jgi:hypothetical protein
MDGREEMVVGEGSGGVVGSGEGSAVALHSVDVERRRRYRRSSESSSGSSAFSSACLIKPSRSRIACVSG